MKHLILFLFLIQISIVAKDIKPGTYIEWENIHPQDTTWWTLLPNHKINGAYKVKCSGAVGVKPWVAEYVSHGEVYNREGFTLEEYQKKWRDKTNVFLPIEYFVGTWDYDPSTHIIRFEAKKVLPGRINGVARDMNNVTWIQHFRGDQYINVQQITDDAIIGFQCDENGEKIPLRDSTPILTWSKWYGQGIDEPSNPIFDQ